MKNTLKKYLQLEYYNMLFKTSIITIKKDEEYDKQRFFKYFKLIKGEIVQFNKINEMLGILVKN